MFGGTGGIGSTRGDSAPRVEVATPADLETLMALRISQDWAPNETLLTSLLAWDGARIFVVRAGAVDPAAEHPERPIASTVALAAGPTAVIGNVVVSADYQRRGLGRALMVHATDWQRERGAVISLLDATIAGRPLYRSLGYVPTDVYSWYAHAPLAAADREVLLDRAAGLRAQVAPAEALARVAALDAAAYGGDRIGLLAALVRRQNVWLYVVEDSAERVQGYALVRLTERLRVGIRIGPLIATSPESAAALLLAATAEDAPWRKCLADDVSPSLEIQISLPPLPDAAFALYAQASLRILRDDLIMRLDLQAATPGAPSATEEGVGAGPFPWSIAPHPEWVWAWIAPMVF